MNKKLVMIGASIALGSVMLVSTAFAGISGTSGYEAYKAALKSTKEAKNMTAKVQLTMKDNDRVIVQAQGVAKMDRESKASSANFTVKSGDKEHTFSSYMTQDKVVKKSSESDEYLLMELDGMKAHGGHGGKMRNHDEEAAKDMEKIVDALAGNFQNYISAVDKAGGEKEVNFEMTGSQISPVVNTIASVAVKQAAREHHQDTNPMKLDAFHQEVKNNLPKLVGDLKVDKVSVKAEIDSNNLVKGQTMDISIVGKDADNNTHTLSMNIGVELTDLNQTTPDTIDLTGKKVKSMKTEMMEKAKEGEKTRIHR